MGSKFNSEPILCRPCYNTAFGADRGRLSWELGVASVWQFPQSVPLTSCVPGTRVCLGNGPKPSSLAGHGSLDLTTPTTSLARETTNQEEGGSGDSCSFCALDRNYEQIEPIILWSHMKLCDSVNHQLSAWPYYRHPTYRLSALSKRRVSGKNTDSVHITSSSRKLFTRLKLCRRFVFVLKVITGCHLLSF